VSAVLGVFRIRCLSGVLADAPCWALVTPVYNVEASPQPFSLASELGKGQIGKGSVRIEKLDEPRGAEAPRWCRRT
jgi:hypothetical protein